MSKIPKQNVQDETKRIKPQLISWDKDSDERIVFSFRAVERNDYFDLDPTCQHWANDLFHTMEEVSRIKISEIRAGAYSGKRSPLRIHPHPNATSPCKLPARVSLEDMWQIRISVGKGGIHGIFYENIFFVIWFDPLHNLYPDKNHGGLTKVRTPHSCYKDEVIELKERIKELEEKNAYLQEENEYLYSELT